MAGGLGRTQDKEKNREEEEDAAGEEGLDGERKKRKVIDLRVSLLYLWSFQLFSCFYPFTSGYNHVIYQG